MARQLKTGWICIATSGSVVYGKSDGRKIEKQWLLDMAEVFNLDLHTPCLWPDHNRYMNLGKVIALKTEPVTEGMLQGEVQLFAILAPNNALIRANQEGQFCFPSIEVEEDFCGKGKFFLGGVGVTDEPGSSGVTELRFNKKVGKVFPGEKFNVNDHLEEESEEKAKTLIQRIWGNFAKSTQDDINNNPDHETEEDTPMTSEQFKALQDSLKAVVDSMNEVKEGIKNFKVSASEAEVETQEQKFAALQAKFDELEKKLKEQPAQTEETQEQKFAALQAKFEDLDKQFKQAGIELKPGTPTPKADEPEEVTL